MKLPAAVEKSAAKFNQMSVRERVLITGATVAAVVMTWMIAIFDPATAKQRALISEMSSIQETLVTTLDSLQSAAASDPTMLAGVKEKTLAARLAEINAQLDSKSAGLIPPERMVEVIHDVLSRQHGVKLISLHNKPVTSLVQPALSPHSKGTDAPAADQVDAAQTSSGPYMHPVEIIIEGRYLDILAYLRTLEGLSWHFYWKSLELQSTEYPLNRVRIELGTLSMEKEWIGV
jgi:MSHA biogenesis protein MshJ